MKQKTEKRPKDLNFWIEFSLFIMNILYFLLLIFGRYIFDPTNNFYRSLDVFNDAGNPNKAIRIISYMFFFLGVSYVVRYILKKFGLLLKKGRSIVDITCSLIKYAAVIVLAFFILRTLGVDTTAILAGIGILGLIVGLGAQPLIADVIAGLFIVFENVFEVGDIIVVDGFRGVVKEIGIRTTQIEDVGGNIKIVNNSDLKTVINMTDQLSIAICDMSIEYGESIERVESILYANLDKIKANIPDIKEGPFYKGVSSLSDSAVKIRFIAKCEESTKYQVERDMNREFKLLFDKNNINIPFPQVVINKREEKAFKEASKKNIEDSKKFIDEQKELGKNIDDTFDDKS